MYPIARALQQVLKTQSPNAQPQQLPRAQPKFQKPTVRNDTLAEWLRRRPAKPTNTSLAVLHPLALIFLIPPARPTGSSLHSRTPPFSSASFPSFLFPHRPASRPHPSDNRSPIFIASHFHLFSPLCLLSFSWFRGPSCYLLKPPCEVSLPPPGSPTQVGFIAPSSSTMFSTPDLARI